MRNATLFIVFLIVCLVLAAPAAARSANGPVRGTPITGCMVIDQPGTYILTRNLMNVAPGPSGACIVVNADATIDGRGHTLDGIGTDTAVKIPTMDLSDGATVRNLVLTDWNTGVSVSSAFGVSISGCTFRNNRFGVSVADGGADIQNCRISGSDMGVLIEPLSGVGVSNSRIADNGIGVVIDDFASVVITNNYFRNAENVLIRGDRPLSSAVFSTELARGRNIVGGKWLGGNYWSDYSPDCLDADRNWICDDPYPLGDYRDSLPLTGPVRGRILR
ncbi:MAG: NosD domain-containing protein [Methanomicrobiales archaeon]|nr:NosD domain-containing protein [Methanomicrobiales archaeon]MDI6876482.1 NosD domain-containing protein [Methanomicrobiales archaeon]